MVQKTIHFQRPINTESNYDLLKNTIIVKTNVNKGNRLFVGGTP